MIHLFFVTTLGESVAVRRADVSQRVFLRHSWNRSRTEDSSVDYSAPCAGLGAACCCLMSISKSSRLFHVHVRNANAGAATLVNLVNHFLGSHIFSLQSREKTVLPAALSGVWSDDRILCLLSGNEPVSFVISA